MSGSGDRACISVRRENRARGFTTKENPRPESPAPIFGAVEGADAVRVRGGWEERRKKKKRER
jgi:hypothetical protein